MADYERHPLSSAYPGMEPTDFDALTEDIKANGLHDPITLYDGKVLDGWHRYQACLCSEISPRFHDFTDLDPVSFVRSKNQHRRHLSKGQRGSIEAALSAWVPAGRPVKGAAAAPFTATVAAMAKNAGVSERTIQQAKTVEKAGLGDEVRAGNITLERAVKIAKLPEAERPAAIAEAPPKPVKQAAPLTSDEASELHALRAERDDLIDQLADLASDLKAYMKAEEGDEAVIAELKALNNEVETLKVQRDGQLEKNAVMAKQIKALKRKLEKYEKAKS